MATYFKTDLTKTEQLPANGKKFTLEELQAAVGGYIEFLELPDGSALVCNEDGLSMGLELNLAATQLARRVPGLERSAYIVGNVLHLTRSEFEEEEEDDYDADDDDEECDLMFALFG
jgi:hypothetical protein